MKPVSGTGSDGAVFWDVIGDGLIKLRNMAIGHKRFSKRAKGGPKALPGAP